MKVVAKDGTHIMLTPQQKAYADLKVERPGASLASIASEVYPNANPDSVRQIVNKNEQNKNITLYSNEQLSDAKTFIHETVNNTEAKTRDRLTAAFRIEDRVLGTPVQQIISQTQGVTLHIDLTSALIEE
tara:strand:- start:8 stop:397 length:390 start_codon:yes stop_codon:yes gene_type:complete